MNEDIRKTTTETVNVDNYELTDEQLEQTTGGTAIPPIQTIAFRICSADHSHIFPGTYSACPTCGSTKYTTLR